MIFKVLLVTSLLGFVLSLPTTNNGDVTVLRSGKEQDEDGSYKFFYETSDGQKREETGNLVYVKGNEPHLKVEGSYSYVGPDGKTYQVIYVADKDGFRPQKDHSPVIPSFDNNDIPPPLALPPNAIKSLIG